MRINRWILTCILCLLIPELGQADEQIHIYVGAPGRSKVPIALPAPSSQLPAATELYSVIKNDLEKSGWVEVVDPNTYLERTGAGVKEGSFRFENWDSAPQSFVPD